MKQPVRIAVTGPAGQIGYSILFRLASGAMLGPTSPCRSRSSSAPTRRARPL